MNRRHAISGTATAALVCIVAAGLAAQSALVQLGLTETAARAFVLNEIRSPSKNRTSPIVVAGTRAFLKLPAAARGAAAAGLFAWATSYVGSPAFAASYGQIRRERIPEAKHYDLTVEQEVRKRLDEQLAAIAQMRAAVATMPAADRAAMLEAAGEGEKRARDPELFKQMQAMLAAERAEERGRDAALTAAVEEAMPADPKTLFARRLREFLDATADVDFGTKTISLTGGPDGIEFVDPAARTKPWIWQEAVIVGREATASARTAAQAWLMEIER